MYIPDDLSIEQKGGVISKLLAIVKDLLFVYFISNKILNVFNLTQSGCPMFTTVALDNRLAWRSWHGIK